MRFGPMVVLALAVAVPAAARPPRPLARSYLTLHGGGGVLTGDTHGDVIRGRGTGLVEIGVGHQIAKAWLLEFTYGWSGRFEQDPPIYALTPEEAGLSDAAKAYRVTINPLFLRARWARGGARTGYFKPELSAGLGAYQVTRLLRNFPGVPPFDTSQLLATGEVGLAALWVFSDNFMGYVGGRYALTEREAIVDDLHHLDGFGFVLGFRSFLPSPRDATP